MCLSIRWDKKLRAVNASGIKTCELLNYDGNEDPRRAGSAVINIRRPALGLGV